MMAVFKLDEAAPAAIDAVEHGRLFVYDRESNADTLDYVRQSTVGKYIVLENPNACTYTFCGG